MGSIKHVFTNAIPDGTNTQIVRPSDWNSDHTYFLQDAVSLAGNTAGVLAAITTGTLILAGGNNVTLSQNGNSVTIVGATAAPSPVGISAGGSSDSLGNVVFSNSNGVSFGLNGSTITATVATNYQSQGAYLTTAARSQDSSNYAGVGESVGTVAGTDLGLTVNTDGVSILYPKWLTTAQPTGAYLTTAGLSQDSSKYAGTGFTTTSVAGSVVAGTHDTNGLKLAVPAFLTTAQSPGAYLTTARASNDAVGLNTALTANGVSWTVNSSGISLNVPAFLTTAQSPGAYLTTARASNDAVGLNTAKTNVTWTVNSSGISLDAGGYLTTAMASNRGSDFVAATAAFAGTNASGTIASNGISVSVAAPGAAAENNWHNLLGANTAGNTTASGSTLGFSGVNMTLSGTNNSQIVLSVPATSSLVGTNGISIASAGSTISVSLVEFTRSRFNPFIEAVAVAGQHGQGSLHVHPIADPDHFCFDRIGFDINWTNATNSSGSATVSMWAGIYTRNASSLSLLGSASGSVGVTFAGTGGNQSLQAGGRLFTIPWTTTMTKADLWMAIVSRTTSGNTDASVSQYMVSDINSNFSGVFGEASNATKQDRLGLGYYSATTSGIPGSLAFSQIRGTASLALRPPLYCFLSGTV